MANKRATESEHGAPPLKRPRSSSSRSDDGADSPSRPSSASDASDSSPKSKGASPETNAAPSNTPAVVQPARDLKYLADAADPPKPAPECMPEGGRVKPAAAPGEKPPALPPIDVDVVISTLNTPEGGAEVMRAYANEITAHQQVQAYAKLAGSGWTYYVQQLRVVIGRNATEAIDERVDIDLAPSKIVSRRHAIIEYNLSTRQWEIQVLGRNGIRIDNMPVRPNSTATLRSGTVLDAGNMQMMFVLPDAEPQVAPIYFQRLKEQQLVREQAASAASYPRGVTILSRSQYTTGDNFVAELSRDECKDIKPPFSYATMIAQSILSTPEHKMTLADIYHWISSHYAFYRHSKPGWQNSIRHNLSLNKAFEKSARRENEPGKGSKWYIVDAFKDELIRKATTGQQHRGAYTPRRPFDALPHPTNRGTHSTSARAAAVAAQSQDRQGKHTDLRVPMEVRGLPQGPPGGPTPNDLAAQFPMVQGGPAGAPPAGVAGVPAGVPAQGMAQNAVLGAQPNVFLGFQPMGAFAGQTSPLGAAPGLPPPPSGAYGMPCMTPYGIQYYNPQTGQMLSPQHQPQAQGQSAFMPLVSVPAAGQESPTAAPAAAQSAAPAAPAAPATDAASEAGAPAHQNGESRPAQPPREEANAPDRIPPAETSGVDKPTELETPARRPPRLDAGSLLDSAIKLEPNNQSGLPESSPAFLKYVNLESTPNHPSPPNHTSPPQRSSTAKSPGRESKNLGPMPLMEKWEDSKA